ncbi:MAG: MBL fold metallo-hydrolase [Candidatus Thorarchaeota archaeon]|jgi:glyoxylase-like metal-dependent hydrolase (beta-lactamase superfamily II)
MSHQGVGEPQVLELASGITAITRLVHFFAPIGVNAGIIQTPEAIIFIDSGMSLHSGEYIWSIAEEKMTREEDLLLILTHKDTDHCFGMDAMKRRGAHVLAHAHSAEIMRTMGDLSNNSIANRIIRKFYPEDVLGNVVVSEPDEVIIKDIILDIEDEIRILSVPGHTPGDLAVYHKESKVLFTGDVVVEGRDPNIRRDSIGIATWISNLERLKELDVEWVVPGHGAVSKPDIIDSNIQFLQKHL